MKSDRHNKILELITDHTITTQEELLERLRTLGFAVTQATISRDIKELHLIKRQSKDGRYCYARPHQEQSNGDIGEFKALFLQAVLQIDYAENTVVIKCRAGMANAVCVSLDAIHWKGLVGTLAGDDTIFILMRTREDSVEMARQLSKLMQR